jgi:CDP-diacylglycerol--glycerol-3-phosphate 3-phosphatidyltransferase/cardiolipin synthase
MGVYRARDLFNVPSLISLARIPLGVGFALTVDSPKIALSLIALSGLSDVADGWWARKTGQVTATGAAVDPVTDKWFVLCVVLALVSRGSLSWASLALLSTREIGEFPLVVWMAFSQHARRARVETPMANVPGKLATALQFAAITMALFRTRWVEQVVYLTAFAGALAAVSYWRRALQASRRVSSAPA